ENRKEFKATGVYDVRRMADGNVYAPEKLKDARKWLYEQDHYYQRMGFWVALVATLIALATFAVKWIADRQAPTASAISPAPITANAPKSEKESQTQPSK